MYRNNIVLEDLECITNSGINWNDFRNSTVLITGANGMIATYLVYVILYLNDKEKFNNRVVALVRNGIKSRQHFNDIIERSDFEMIVQDVCSEINYNEKIDYIIHAASQASPNSFLDDPVGTISVNTIGTINMLNLAYQKKSKSFVFLSTREIYGKPFNDSEFVTESDYGTIDPTLVRSCYPESKRMSETLCAAYKHQHGVNCKIVRIAHTYGPGIAIGDGRIIGDFIEKLISKKPIIIHSDGSARLALTYLSDTIIGIFMVMLNFNDFVYNISNHNSIITVKELAEKLSKMYKDRQVKVLIEGKSEISKMGYLPHKVGLINSGKACNEGWMPKITIEEGFRRTITFCETQNTLSL